MKNTLSRLEFIEQTNVFITHVYYEMVVNKAFENSGLSQSDFCKKWLDENQSLIKQIELTGSLRFIIDDDDLSHISYKTKDADAAAILDLLNNLSETLNTFYSKSMTLAQEFAGIKEDIERVNCQISIINEMIQPDDMKIKKFLS